MHHLKNWKITTKCVNGEISSMAVSHIEFYSEKLEMKTRVNVILPEHVDKDGQVLLLLHGLGDDENTWFEQTRIVSYASGSNITVIMPRVDRSYYTTSVGGPNILNMLVRKFYNDVKNGLIYRITRNRPL